jgi:hypothetical protein
MGLLKNKCNDTKGRALRKILESMNWINVVDETYDFNNHISMRYVLETSHPYYKSYEKIVGANTIRAWREYKQSLLGQQESRVSA